MQSENLRNMVTESRLSGRQRPALETTDDEVINRKSYKLLITRTDPCVALELAHEFSMA